MPKFISDPWIQPINSSGVPYPGAKLLVQDAGTTTNRTTYSDSALSVANANPLIADAAGRFGPMFLAASATAIKLTLNDASDNLIDSQDNIPVDDQALNSITAAETASGLTTADLDTSYAVGDIRRYGALTTASDNSAAIQSACDTGHPVYIPEGTWVITSETDLTSAHNGLYIHGAGYNSVIQLGDSLAAATRVFDCRDASTAMDSITFANFRMDGNRSNNGSTANRGIWFDGTAGTFATNISLFNVWAHSFGLSGFSFDVESMQADRLFGWDNLTHGVSLIPSTGVTAPGGRYNLSNIFCWSNTQLGIDFSSENGTEQGVANVNNLFCWSNTLDGGKSAGDWIIHGSNWFMISNTGKGWRTNFDFTEIKLTNYNSYGNTDDGFDNSNDGTVIVNGLSSQDDGSLGVFLNDGDIQLYGVNVNGSDEQGIFASSTVDSLVIDGFTVDASAADGGSIASVDITADKAILSNGKVRNGLGTIGVRIGEADVTIKDTLIEDTNGSPVMVNGISNNSQTATERLVLDNVEFGTGITTAISDTSDPTIIARDCVGFVTRAKGTGEIANGTTTDTIAHGLAVTPNRADIEVVLAEQATNDPGDIYIGTIDATNFVVNCRNDPGASGLDFAWKVHALTE